MAQQFPGNGEQGPTSPPPVNTDWRETRRERTRASGPWLGGIILILLGFFFLAQNLGFATLDNWWALFILIPAVGSFATAWSIFQGNGNRMTGAVRGPLMGGLILAMVAAAFLLNLNWGLLWPLFLILIGVGALITAFVPE